MTAIVKLPKVAGVLGLILISLGCENDDISPRAVADYFPLEENAGANYLKEYVSTGDELTIWWTDTLMLKVSGDTLIDGLYYKRIMTQYGTLEKVVRSEGSRYFGRNHELYGGFSREYMFLDASLPAGSKWEHIKDEGLTKTEYIIEEVNSTYVVRGIEFKDVIKVKVNYYDAYTDGETLVYKYSAEHVYANGIGEIYAHYPYPASGVFSDLKISILSSSK